MTEFPFLRTWKPVLKRARGTEFYPEIRRLLQLWLHCKRITRILEGQNQKLYKAARDRDRMLSEGK
jgi:hypothetical protein